MTLHCVLIFIYYSDSCILFQDTLLIFETHTLFLNDFLKTLTENNSKFCIQLLSILFLQNFMILCFSGSSILNINTGCF